MCPPGHVNYRLDLISFALKGKKIIMDKAIKMIDDTVVLSKKEQGDDDDKNEMRSSLTKTLSDLEKEIDDTTESIAIVTEGRLPP